MSFTTPKEKSDDRKIEQTLRPKSLLEFVGQDKAKKNLDISIEAAQKRKEPLEHLLFHGGSGLGKTTLAHLLANEMRANIRITSGPAIEKVGDLGAILTNLEEGDILFIDEIHRLNKLIEEVLYPAMEDFVLDIIIGKGPSARTIRLDIPKFTLIGATTRMGLISSPLLNRFGIVHRLDFYSNDEIQKIVKRSGKILDVMINSEGAGKIAQSSRQTPRVANRLIRRVRDYAQVKGDGIITEEIAEEALRELEVDHLGLEEADRKILKTIIEKFNGGPVGLGTISSAVSEEKDTLEDVYEPYLVKLGFIARTPRGRIATKLAYEHLGIEYPEKEQSSLL